MDTKICRAASTMPVQDDGSLNNTFLQKPLKVVDMQMEEFRIH